VSDSIPSKPIPQRCLDLDAVFLALAVVVFVQRHIAHPVPTVIDRPAMSDSPEQAFRSDPQTRDVATGLVLLPAISYAMVATVMIFALLGHALQPIPVPALPAGSP
jgi:hypothetical protein